MKKTLLVSVICFALAAASTATANSRLVINSAWTSTPPIIDGNFGPREWINPEIIIRQPIEAYIYFANNRSNLFVLVDATGDATDDPQDECLLVFSSDGTLEVLEIVGLGGVVASNSIYAAIGYGGSPNNSTSHKIYEWSIPLSLIDALNNRTLDFCSPPWKHGIASMPYDPPTGRDNIWPEGLVEGDRETWGILKLAEEPETVGGEIESYNNLTLLVPPLFAFILASAAAASGILLRRKPVRT